MSQSAEPLAITIAGAGGRMGRMLVARTAETEGCRLAGALEPEGSEALGADAGTLAGVGELGVAVESDAAAAIARADAVIDFTAPAATVAHARLCAEAGTALVVGTTGLSAEDAAVLDEAAKAVPVVHAPNMSAGVNLLFALTRKVAATLGIDYDIEIVEMHHRHKVDAPSGTALGLGRAAAEGRGVDHDDAAILSREGHTGARPDGAIGYAALRGGEVIGEHTAVFAGASERIELTHKAGDRSLFAAGAVRAAQWTRGRAPGLYGMADVLGLDL